MEFQTLVEERRSIRAYGDEKISKEDLEKIIRLAQKAPSWKNFQPSRFYAALSDEAVAAVAAALPEFNQHNSLHAAYIVTTFKKGLSGSTPDKIAEEGDCWGAYDLGLSNAYLVLAAKEYGYDTLIMGIRDAGRIRDYFGISEEEMILPVIAIGKAAQDPVKRPRKELSEVLKIR